MKKRTIFSLFTLSLMLTACASTPELSTPEVALSQDQSVHLPTPQSLGYRLAASQLIEASWQQDKQSQSQQLPVQLQVGEDQLVLAGFSSWGTRILSVNYQQGRISSDVMAGLGATLPKPEQVLFNLMITLWPSSAWEGPLNKVRWQLVDNDDSRVIFNSDGDPVIDIQYSNQDRLNGTITFRHLIDNYTISIKTLQFQRQPITP
ncbi:DUF3261 domain-containing protein [Vibrio sinaloensis]|uniref:DUF3261 domain-containing protein n=1 Tax=Photobacterium sp. (strain ATCC 43367) TaxID=379097 RepID=UPI0020563530|nr:DUF3261 domain-containing protein [Vibrio sinaloensis]UPQ89368.1 DUF3261 domain-containing protein [Vibrio sinaloensis]